MKNMSIRPQWFKWTSGIQMKIAVRNTYICAQSHMPISIRYSHFQTLRITLIPTRSRVQISPSSNCGLSSSLTSKVEPISCLAWKHQWLQTHEIYDSKCKEVFIILKDKGEYREKLNLKILLSNMSMFHNQVKSNVLCMQIK